MTEIPSKPDGGEIPSSLWWITAVVVAAPVICIAVLSWQLHWDWLPNLWFNYAWSSDKGNGPEALQQTIIYAAIAVVFVPVVRRWLGREFHKVHAKIDEVHDTVKAHHEEAKTEREELHNHLHHMTDKLGIEKYQRKETP